MRWRRLARLFAVLLTVCFTGQTPASGGQESALITAIRSADLAAVRECIARGDRVNVLDEEGLTPLIWAAASGYREIAEQLLDAGAPIDGRGALGGTPLARAVRGRKPDMVRLLLDRGADVNARDRSGWSPLFFAALTGSAETTAELISKGADVHVRDLYKATPLLLSADLGGEPALRELVQAGADINAQDNEGNTALILASYRGHIGIAKFLLDRGADVNLTDTSGRTALMFASMIGFDNIVKMLLTHGADVRMESKHGETALSLALDRGHEAIGEMLAQKLGTPPDQSRTTPQTSTAKQTKLSEGSREVRSSVRPEASGDVVVVNRGSKVSQLVGEFDRQRNELTKNRTLSRYKLVSTDLGAPFRHKNRIYLLFGDTGGVKGGDAIAYTGIDTKPEEGMSLTFVHDAEGVYKPVRIPGISQGNFEVPMEGVSVGGAMYIYHTTDHSRKAVMGRSVVAASRDDGVSFQYLYDLSLRYFINVSIVEVDSSKWKGLPASAGTGLVMFGSGAYRKSPVRLAFQPATDIESRDAIRYFAGSDVSGSLRWSTREEAAVPLFDQACVGELSVSYNRFIRKWIMLYNCRQPMPTVLVRTSDYPWGPWSDPQMLFDPSEDNGFCQFVHRSWTKGKCDILSDPGRQDHSGGSYGPYQFEDLAVGDATTTTIYFTLSTWNPYTVVLMKATLGIEGTPLKN